MKYVSPTFDDGKAGDTLSSRHVSSCHVSSPHELCATTEIWEACWHVRLRDVSRVTEVWICAIEFNGNPPLNPNCTRNITWARVMLRVQLGCEKRFNIEFYGADSHFCHTAYVTWSHVPARLSHFCCRTHFVRCDDVTYVSSALQTLSILYLCFRASCFIVVK